MNKCINKDMLTMLIFNGNEYKYERIPGELKYGIKKLVESSKYKIKNKDIEMIQFNKKHLDYKFYDNKTIFKGRYSDISFSLSFKVFDKDIVECSSGEYGVELNFYINKKDEYITVYITENKQNKNIVKSFFNKIIQYNKTF